MNQRSTLLVLAIVIVVGAVYYYQQQHTHTASIELPGGKDVSITTHD